MQSAKANNHTWVLDWETLQGAGRWENPLMGWASTYLPTLSDLSSVSMFFSTEVVFSL
jgi:hypothetical protein